MKNKYSQYTCLRCGHTWNPQKAKPKRCPGCGNPYWDVPRTQKKWTQEEVKMSLAGKVPVGRTKEATWARGYRERKKNKNNLK